MPPDEASPPGHAPADLGPRMGAAERRLAELGRAVSTAERRAREAWSVLELARRVQSSLDFDEVVQQIAEAVRTLLRVTSSTLYRLDEPSAALIRVAVSGEAARPGNGVPGLPPGVGVAGLAVRERRPVVSDDVLADSRVTVTPELRQAIERASYRVVLALPLVVRDRVIGALAVADHPGRRFDQDEIRLIQAFADQAALALGNARLYEETRRRVTELATVQRLAQVINSTLRLDTIFQSVVTQVSAAFGYRLVYASLASPEGLRVQAAVGYESLVPLIPWSQGLTGRVARSGRGELVRDARSDRDFVIVAPGTRQGIVVPMKSSDGEVLGTLGVESTGDPDLTERDLALLTLLADQISVAVANARLYTEATRRQREAEELARVARTLTESLDLAAVAQRIVDSVLPLFGVASSELTVLQADAQLTTLAVSGRGAPGSSLVPEPGFTGRVLEAGGPIWTRDRLADSDVDTGPARARLAEAGCRAMLGVPLRVKGELRGVLSIADPEPREFSTAEVTLLQAFADQAAIALENGRLYGELERALHTVEESQQRVVQGERLRALGELAGGVAHDFNNVLAVILGRAQLLAQREAGAAAVRRQAQIIEQVALEGAQTVRRIQEFARKRRSRPFQPVDLDQLVADAVEVTASRWRHEARAQARRYEIRVEAGGVPPFPGDPHDLREALTNLVLNALDAMPHGGHLTLATAVEGQAVVCRVSDTGVGMSEEVRQRVFDPFFTTKGERGSGLGLSLVYGMIQRHGGTVEVESQPGRGSTFVLRFPLPVPGGTTPAAPASAPAAPPRPAAILLVDDEAVVRDVLQEVLIGQGHRVVACADGPAALEQLVAERFDLVLTDLGLPGMSGWEVAREVKRRCPTLPVALVTGWGDQIEPDEARARGVDYLVAKPCRAEELLALVAQAVTPGDPAAPPS